MQATRQEAEIRMDLAVAAENTEYSGKWELPAGSAEHPNCVRGLGLHSGCATKSPAIFEQLLKAQPHAVRSGRGGSAGSDCNGSISSARLRQDRPPLRFAALPREIARSGAVDIHSRAPGARTDL